MCIWSYQISRVLDGYRHFELITDHKPLLSLFNEHKAFPNHASARIQRWALTLVAYKYTLVSRRTDAHTNGDALSRLPLTETMRETPAPAELILILEQVQDMPVTDKQIKTLTIYPRSSAEYSGTLYSTRLA